MHRFLKFALSSPGGDGNRAGPVPAVLLLEIVRPAQHGSDRDELRLSGVEDRGSAPTHPRRHQRVSPHQAGPRSEVSIRRGSVHTVHQPVRLRFLLLFC